MQKIFAFGAIVLGAFAHTHHHTQEVAKVAAWPELNLYTTFKSDVTLHTFDGKQLKSFKDISATAKIDGDRNKIHIDAKVKVPVFGQIPAEILIDTKQGTLQLYVPTLQMCQQEDLPPFDLKQLLLQFYSEQGGLTVYDGDSKPAWDTVTYDKFHATLAGDDLTATLDAYVDKQTHNGRWLQLLTDAKKDPKIIVNVPKGEEPATFQDSDFTLQGCNGKTFITEEEKMVRLFRP